MAIFKTKPGFLFKSGGEGKCITFCIDVWMVPFSFSENGPGTKERKKRYSLSLCVVRWFEIYVALAE
jgi:hypothetical protein